MLVVRAIKEQDVDGLLALATQTGEGMTTLKADRDMLAKRIELACASFAESVPAARRDYLFVMEDTATHALVGACAIKSAVGLDEPFYNYRLGVLVHSSKELDVFSRMDTLHLSNDLTGCAELCSLFLHPDYRVGNNGKLLSKSRFLFMAQFPHLFPEKIVAEMRGFQRADGSSPFWDNLGRHFFKMDFNRADDLSTLGNKSFIAELMPRHPLYVAYLPPEAQQVIGRVHVDTAPARRLLEQEGMHYEGYVDIFDAGPVLQASRISLSSLRPRQPKKAASVCPTTTAIY
jgi:arginine N-succinyltransferase